MEISRKFFEMLSYGDFFNNIYLPKHGKEAILKAAREDSNFVEKLIEAQHKNLVDNYGVPEEMTDCDDRRQHLMEKFHDRFYGYDGWASMYYFENLMYHMCIGLMSETGTSSRFQAMRLRNAIYDSMCVSGFSETEGLEHPGMVSRYKDIKSKDKEGNPRKTRSRFARAFNQQFPGFPEAFVDALNDVWKESYGELDLSKYHMHFGRTTDHFLAAYENLRIGQTSNITTTVFTKHLCNSCMQYERDDDDSWEHYAYRSGLHCVEAYVTTDEQIRGIEVIKGDPEARYFEVMYITNKEDPFDYDASVYGRSVFSRKPDGEIEFGPFYVTSNIIKSLMMMKIPDLLVGDIYTPENKKEFMSKIERSISRADSKDCYDFPPIWDGSVLRALDKNGSPLRIDKWLVNAEHANTPVIAPYIDVGNKSVYPVLNHKDGYVYLKVFARDQKDHENYDEDIGLITHNDIAFNRSRFIGHQGVNYIGQVTKRKECSECGELSFSTVEVKGKHVCRKCIEKKYVLCEMTGVYVEKNKMKTVKRINQLYFKSNSEFQLRVWNHVTRNLGMSDGHCLIYSPVDFNFRDILVDENYEPNVVKNTIYGCEILNNLCFPLHESYWTIIIDDELYFKFDDRVCYDMINEKVVLDKDAKKLFFMFRNDTSVTIKINKKTYDTIAHIVENDPELLGSSVEETNGSWYVGSDNQFLKVLGVLKGYVVQEEELEA